MYRRHRSYTIDIHMHVGHGQLIRSLLSTCTVHYTYLQETHFYQTFLPDIVYQSVDLAGLVCVYVC